MHLFSSKQHLNVDTKCLSKGMTINNNNNGDDILLSDANKFSSSSSSPSSVIPNGTTAGGSIESDIVMVTYTYNGTTSSSSNSSTSTLTTTSTIQGSISGSTLPMRLQIMNDRLILLRKENEVNEDDEGDQDEDGLMSINDSGLLRYQKVSGNGGSSSRRQIDEYRTVKLVREKSVGFGLSIKGGCEHGLPILISGLTKEGPADRSRQLFIGDAIVRIDSTVLSLTTTTHEEAIKLLKQAGVEVNLTVKHFKMVSPFLTKCWRKRQTLDNEAGNLTVSTTKGTTIKKGNGKQSIECDLLVTNGSRSSSNSDKNNNYGKEKGKVKKDSNGTVNRSDETDKWIPLISIDLGNCFVTKYVHDSDKIRPQSFEIRWLTNFSGHSHRSNSSSCPSTSSSTIATVSETSSSSSSTTSLSTPKSTDSGVGVATKSTTSSSTNTHNNSTSTSKDFKEPLPIIGGGKSGLDGKRWNKTYSSAIVICNNQQIYSQWFSIIEASVKNVTNHQMVKLNQQLPVNEKILFMGWINQGLPTTSSEPHRPCYHWYTRYLVIKGGDALIYIKPPQGLLFTSNDNSSSTTDSSKTTTTTTTSSSSSSSSHPNITWSEGHPYLFKAHQSILRCLQPSEYVDERENCFLLLSCDTNCSSSSTVTKPPLPTNISSHPDDDDKSDLTVNPIESTVCYFSVETPNELALIRNNWNRATYQSVTQLGSKSFPVTCSGKLGSLILDYEYGFTFSASAGQHHGDRSNNKLYHWSFKFSQLKTSSDDGHSTLWLSFRVPLLSSSSSSSSSSPSSSTSSRYEINKERLRRLTINPNHGRSSDTLIHSSTSSITVASDNPNQPTTTSSSSSSSSSSSGSLLSSSNHQKQQSESIKNQLTIETREIKTNQLQHLLYCIHAFLTAKVISVDQSFLC